MTGNTIGLLLYAAQCNETMGRTRADEKKPTKWRVKVQTFE